MLNKIGIVDPKYLPCCIVNNKNALISEEQRDRGTRWTYAVPPWKGINGYKHGFIS